MATSAIDTVSVDTDARFVYAATWPTALWEGKSFGTAPLTDIVLLRDLTRLPGTQFEPLARARRVGSGVGGRKLKQVKARTTEGLLDLLQRYRRGRVDDATLRTRAVTLMRQAWRDTFLAGVRASGVPSAPLTGRDDPLVVLEPGDDLWLRGAMTHEMRYFNKFLEAVTTGEFVMPLERRARMYVDTLDSFYDSARIIGLPESTVIHWVTPGDGRSCASCVFLQEHSPYLKATLPCPPRGGLQLCVTSCRDWLYLRQGSPREVREIREATEYTRDGFIRKLRQIKRVGHAGGA